MDSSIPSSENTFLTHRQIEVLALRERGLSQKDIASQFGTTIANISSIETNARHNIDKAKKTLLLSEFIQCIVIFNSSKGSDLWDIASQIYAAADNNNIKISYTEPELIAFINGELKKYIKNRKTTMDIDIGLTARGSLILIHHPTN